MAAKHKSRSPKVTALLAEGTFNPAAERVRDPKFREHDFFDPCDLVQVKYELLRQGIEQTPTESRQVSSSPGSFPHPGPT